MVLVFPWLNILGLVKLESVCIRLKEAVRVSLRTRTTVTVEDVARKDETKMAYKINFSVLPLFGRLGPSVTRFDLYLLKYEQGETNNLMANVAEKLPNIQNFGEVDPMTLNLLLAYLKMTNRKSIEEIS